MIKKKNPKAVHYVNNEEMYLALVDYFRLCDEVEAKWNKIYGKQKQKLIKQGAKEKRLSEHGIPDIEWPRVPEYLGRCMYEIATRSNNMPNFCSYSYKDEMIADGYEDCILRIRSFNIDQALIKVYSVDSDGKEKLLFAEGTREKFIKGLKKYGFKVNLKDFEKKIKNQFKAEVSYKDCKIKINRNPFAYFTTACYYASVRRIKKEKKQKLVKSEMIKNSGIITEMQSSTNSFDDAAYDNNYLSFLLDNVDQEKEMSKDKSKAYQRTTKAHQRKLKDMEELETEEIERQNRVVDDRYADVKILDSKRDDSIDAYYDQFTNDE